MKTLEKQTHTLPYDLAALPARTVDSLSAEERANYLACTVGFTEEEKKRYLDIYLRRDRETSALIKEAYSKAPVRKVRHKKDRMIIQARRSRIFRLKEANLPSDQEASSYFQDWR